MLESDADLLLSVATAVLSWMRLVQSSRFSVFSATSLKAELLTQSHSFENRYSLWEISIKISIGKLTLVQPFDIFLQQQLTNNDIQMLPISLAHLGAVSTLPFHHRDPFDRLLIAQAIVEKVPVVSIDEAFDAYSITRLW